MTNYKKTRLFLFLLIIFVIGNLYFLFTRFAFSKNQIELYFFYGQDCPYCAKMADILKEVQGQYPELKINALEVWYNPQSQKLLTALAESYKIKPEGVPVVFVGNLAVEGTDSGAIWQIKEEVRRCSISPCPSPIEKIKIEENKLVPNFKNIGLIAGGLVIFLILIFSFLKKKKSG